jgi:hypothetical protein
MTTNWRDIKNRKYRCLEAYKLVEIQTKHLMTTSLNSYRLLEVLAAILQY